MSPTAWAGVNLPSMTPVRIIARRCSFPFIVMVLMRGQNHRTVRPDKVSDHLQLRKRFLEKEVVSVKLFAHDSVPPRSPAASENPSQKVTCPAITIEDWKYRCSR